MLYVICNPFIAIFDTICFPNFSLSPSPPLPTPASFLPPFFSFSSALPTYDPVESGTSWNQCSHRLQQNSQARIKVSAVTLPFLARFAKVCENNCQLPDQSRNWQCQNGKCPQILSSLAAHLTQREEMERRGDLHKVMLGRSIQDTTTIRAPQPLVASKLCIKPQLGFRT